MRELSGEVPTRIAQEPAGNPLRKDLPARWALRNGVHAKRRLTDQHVLRPCTCPSERETAAVESGLQLAGSRVEGWVA